MRRVDSQALEGVAKALDLAGQGSEETFFADGELVQTFDTVASVRRGQTLADTEGIFTGSLIVTTVGAENVSNDIDPYNLVSTVDAIPPYPGPVPDHLDVWLLPPINIFSVAGVIDNGWFGFRPNRAISFGTLGTANIPIFSYDGEVIIGADRWGVVDGQDSKIAWTGAPIRIPRGWLLRHVATTLIAGSVTARFPIGIFPAGLGQDYSS